MSGIAANAARSAGKAVGKAANKTPQGHGKDAVLQKGAKKDPELYVCSKISLTVGGSTRDY